jgi:Zn-dependent protease with chaperone function
VDIDRFKSMVARLEQESAAAPRRYRVKVALLALLGFAILALVLATVGLGLLALVGIAGALAFTGGAALLILLKLGKVLFLLAIPLWFTLKSAVQALFMRLPAPRGREITREQAPALFAALDDMRRKMAGPRFHHVLVVNDMNAAVVQRPAFGLVGWPRNYLLLGLPLMECLAPDEAQAVIAHEYGHLAGSHGRFSAFIYRLRHTWATVQAYMEHIHGWLAKLVAPLVRWYAPYFNAYTYVLARADEYNADAASVQLVGARSAAHALKRVNLAAPHYHEFLQATYRRAGDEPAPPADLLHAWASIARTGTAEENRVRWLDEALDRQGEVTDTHPPLRARLSALSADPAILEALPPAVDGPTASEAWFGSALPRLRQELQEGWAADIAQGWTERHAETQTQRARLRELRDMPQRDTDQELELLRLAMDLEPDTDLRQAFADFNAAHPDHAVGLYFEGCVRLDRDEREGLALLERAMALDPDAIKPACARAHAFLSKHKDTALAAEYEARWHSRHAFEAGLTSPSAGG